MLTSFNRFLLAVLLSTALFHGQAFAFDINTATQAEIQASMEGVGEKKAAAIVDYRRKNGKFSSIDDLLKVPGMGEKTLKKNSGALANLASSEKVGDAKDKASSKKATAKDKASSKKAAAKDKASSKKATAKDNASSKKAAAKDKASSKKAAAKDMASSKKAAAKDKASIKKATAKDKASSKKAAAKVKLSGKK